ncbi:MAG: pterin-4-alpha-carbinolamine dehydratase [Saprospirales bacterium]|nr:MAG: pterin-4-alpha-carbinolamine dehydratase [Saprospirales bacterium]
MDWREENDQLVTRVEFKNFRQAYSFMTAVAFLAEEHNHHPDWRNVYNKVEIKLSTHDAGNVVTEKDRKLAKGISEIYSSFGPKS